MSLMPRRSSAFDTNPLGLLSRHEMSKETRRLRDEEIGRSQARSDVIKADIRGLVSAGEVGMAGIAHTNKLADIAAAAMPYDRHRTDSVADIVTALIHLKLRELGGQ